MKKFTTLKTLLVGLLALGATSAWAETYYSESFSAESTVDGWSTTVGGRFDPVILSEGDNYYLSVNQGNRNNNGCVVTGSVINGLVTAGNDFTMTFDLKLGNSNNQEPVSFVVNDAANTNAMLSFTATGKNTIKWILNGDSSHPIELAGTETGKDISELTWYSIVYSRKGTLSYLTIKNKSTDAVVFERGLIATLSETGGLGNMIFTTRRYYANFAIDNIVVRDLEDGDTPNVTATTYTIKYQDGEGNSLKDDVKVSTTVGAEVSASNEQIADFKVTEEETTKKYIYVSGNENITTVEDEASNVITLIYREAAVWSYTVNAKFGETVLCSLASGTVFEKDAATIVFPRYLNNDGVLVKKDGSNKNYSFSFTPDKNNYEANLEYTAANISDVVFFSEAENIETLEPITSAYLAERFSAGKGGYAKDEAKVIATLPAGKYKLTAQIMGTASEATFTFKAGETTIWENATNSNSFYIGDGITSDMFTLTEETDIILETAGGDGSSTRVTNAVDFVYIQQVREPFDFTIKCIDESENVLKEFTLTGTEGEELTCAWSKYIKVDDKWYVTENPYTFIATEAGSKNVVYKEAADIYDFIELESTNYRSAGDIQNNENVSGGVGVLLYSGSAMATKEKIAAGTYDFSIYGFVRRANEDILTVQTSADGETWNDVTTLTFEDSKSQIQTAYAVTLSEDSYVRFLESTSKNTCHYFDYLVITETPTSVPVRITAAGYATYCSQYDLDFSSFTEVQAFVAEENEGVIGFTKTDVIPANTGMLLKGIEGNYDIPITTGAASVSSALIGVLKNTKVDAGYVLMDIPYVGFFKAGEFTVGANTAYLPAAVEARIVLPGNEATAIKTIEAEQLNGEIYNLAGQRVKSAKKGLYIMDGKKVIK